MLVLWLNSTLGLLILLAHREETQGAWVKFKKPVLTELSVLDIHALRKEQRRSLARAYDKLSKDLILPFPHMANNPTRQKIDEAIARAVGLPDFAVLREMLAREPVVCLQPLA